MKFPWKDDSGGLVMNLGRSHADTCFIIFTQNSSKAKKKRENIKLK